MLLVALVLLSAMPKSESPFSLRIAGGSAPMVPNPETWRDSGKGGSFGDFQWVVSIDSDKTPYVDARHMESRLPRWEKFCGLMRKEGFNAVELGDLAHLVTYDALEKDDPYAIYPKDSKLRLRHSYCREFFRKLIKTAHEHRLKFLLNTDEFVYTPDVEAWITKNGKPLDADNPRLWELYRAKYRELFTQLPEVDGVILRLGEIYVRGDYRGKAIASVDGKDTAHYKKLVRETYDVVAGEFHKLYIQRTWCMYDSGIHSRPDLYHAVFDDLPTENLLVSVKHTMTDFWYYVPPNPTIGIGKQKQIVEFQARHEFDGQGVTPTVKVHDLQARMRLARDTGAAGVWVWPAEGGVDNSVHNSAWETIPYFGSFPFWNEANVHLLAELAKNLDADVAAVLHEWAASTFGKDAADGIAKMLLLSDEATRVVHYLPSYAEKTHWHPSPTRWFHLFNRGFDPYKPLLGPEELRRVRADISRGPELTQKMLDCVTGCEHGFKDPKTYALVLHSVQHFRAFAELMATWRSAKLADYQLIAHKSDTEAHVWAKVLSEAVPPFERAVADYEARFDVYDLAEVRQSLEELRAAAASVDPTGSPAKRPNSLPVYVRSAGSLTDADCVFLCGRRGAVETFLNREAAGRAAFAPLDAFNRFEVAIQPAPHLIAVRVSPGIVTKEYGFQGGGELSATWSIDRRKPLLQVAYAFTAPRGRAMQVEISADLTSNVGWVNKFAQHDDDRCELDGDALRFCDKTHPDQILLLNLRSVGRERTAPKLAVLAENRGRASIAVDVPAGGRREVRCRIAVGSGVDSVRKDLAARTIEGYRGSLAGAFRFVSPDAELNELMEACSYVELQNVRDLPFGPPYSQDGPRNRTWPVVTASPDYHGVFANDCIQTMWEMGLLGRPMYAASRNSIDTMLAYGAMESVEWFTGDGNVWEFPLPLGNTPQVALGACWHLLWSGDNTLAKRWWPQIKALLALHDKFDSDGDELEDRANTPYPEQPDPGTYNHEMLYVQCFWRQAFARAACVAEWLGMPEAQQYAAKAQRISVAIENVFGTDYGLAVWVDKNHKPHPHIGHEQIIAAAAGDVSDERSRLIVKTETSLPIWTQDRPLRAEPGKGVAAGDHVWTFMRWKLVQALFRLGDVDRALEIADRWAAQERGLLYQAPEAFPTVTGTTGKLYTWTAGRAMRAVVFGLSGLDLTGRGVAFHPRLPSKWSGFEVRGIPVHGASIDLVVIRGKSRIRVDGKDASNAFLPYRALGNGRHVVEVHIGG